MRVKHDRVFHQFLPGRRKFARRPGPVSAMLAVALAVALVAVGPAEETSPDRPAVGPLAGPPPPALSPEALDQLQRLRQQIGPALPADGGPFAPLPGADVVAPPPAARFGEALRRIADAPEASAPPSAAPGEPSIELRVQLLRTAAHRLDEVAHQLEWGDLYDEADRIAGEADRLRMRARGLRRAAVPPATRATSPAAFAPPAATRANGERLATPPHDRPAPPPVDPPAARGHPVEPAR